MRPAAYMQINVVISTSMIPSSGCHRAMPGGTAWRAIISMGVAGGNNEAQAAKWLFGSRITAKATNIGSMANTRIGHISDCVSFMSVQAAPTAMYSEPYMKTDKTW